MAHLPALKAFVEKMNVANSDREHFQAVYAKVTFDIIISLDIYPNEILIGGQGINWACILEISDSFEVNMPDKSFFELRDKLDLEKGGKEGFNSYSFLRDIMKQAPSSCSNKPIPPVVMQRWYPDRFKTNDPEEKTVFYRWSDQTPRNQRAHNFDKTEKYFGKIVANYCRTHNTSSQWLTPEQAEEMHINIVDLKYPWTK